MKNKQVILNFALVSSCLLLSACDTSGYFSALSSQMNQANDGGQTSQTSKDKEKLCNDGDNKGDNRGDKDAVKINNDQEAVSYCQKAGSAQGAIAGVSVELISNHNGSLDIVGERIAGVDKNNGRVVISSSDRKPASVGDIKNINGTVVLCGCNADSIAGIRGSVVLVNSYAKSASGFTGNLRLVNSKVDNVN